MRHYSIYSTTSDLDGPLGQVEPTFPADIYRSSPTDPYELAAELGVTLPPRPGGFTDKEIKGWDSLARIDMISEALGRAYLALLRINTLVGSANCGDLLRFNATTLRLHKAQSDALSIIRASGVKPVPPAVPPPVYFTNVDRVCTSPTQRVPLGPSGAGVSAGACPVIVPGSGLSGFWVVIGVTVVVSVAAYGAIRAICSAFVDIEHAEEITKQTSVEARYQMMRAEALQKSLETCIGGGGNPVDCLESSGESIPQELKALEAMWLEWFKRPGDRWYDKWYWWAAIAAGVTGTAAGVYYVRRN